jgi:diguanylate cyclase (GGDEF)-like protein/PAS domain S-box-containing protein
MSQALNVRMIGGFFVAISAVALGGILLHRSSAGFEQTQQQMARARDFLNEIRSFSATIEHAESAQRGYLLTGDDSYLLEFRVARHDAESLLENVETMARTDERQATSVLRLRNLMQQKLEELEKGIALRRTNGLSAAQKFLRDNSGARRMDSEVGSTLRNLERRQTDLMQSVNAQYSASVARSGTLMVAAFVVQSILLLSLLLQAYRHDAARSNLALEQLLGNVRLQAILSTIGEGIYQFDRQEKLVHLNQIGEQILGYTSDELREKSIHEIIHTSNPDGIEPRESAQRLTEVVAQGAPYQCALDWFRRKDGSFVTVEYNCKPLILSNRIEGAVLSFRDITQRMAVEKALRVSEQRYRNLVDKSRGLICTHDLSGRLISVNEAAAELLGTTTEEIVGKNLLDFLAPGFEQEYQAYLNKIAEWGVHRGLMRVVNRQGEELVWSYSNKLVNEQGQAPYVLGHAQDVTFQMEVERELRETKEKLRVSLENEKNLSRIDFLTKIPNRRAFFEATELELQRAQRYNRPITTVYIDVDNFKHVNDTLGHEIGDKLLRRVAETLRAKTRECNVVARFGGDEFGILLGETPHEGGLAAARNLRNALTKLVGENGWPVSFSIGVATFMDADQSVEEMIAAADELMYEVKKAGKDSISSRIVTRRHTPEISIHPVGEEGPR